MSNLEYSIRIAKAEDAGHLLRLIKELADFGKLLSTIKLTIKDIEECLDTPWCSGFVLEYKPDGKDAEVIGYTIWNYCFSTRAGKMAYMEDLYVSADHRGKGLGSSLMQNVAKIAYEKGCVMLRWIVSGWNQRAKSMYSKVNAENISDTEDWEEMQLEGENFITFAKKEIKIPLDC